MDTQRVCKKCGESKQVAEFGTNKRTKDGIGSTCKRCGANYAKDLRKQRKQGVVGKAPLNGNIAGYFAKLGVSFYVDGFVKTYEIAKREYLNSVQDAAKKHLLGILLDHTLKNSIIPALRQQVPSSVDIESEIKIMKSALARKDAIIEDDKRHIADLYQKLGTPPKNG